jgi:Zn-dependent protease
MSLRFSPTEPIELARYQKAPIYLHPAFFITAIILAWPFWSIGSLRGLALAGLFVAVIFASVLLHELAHAVMAHRYGLPLSRIDIHALGGRVQFRYQPIKRSEDAAITIAGPAANLAIGLVALALLTLVPPARVDDDRDRWPVVLRSPDSERLLRSTPARQRLSESRTLRR